MAPRMRFEYGHGTVTMYPDKRRMKQLTNLMMTQQRPDIIKFQFNNLCGMLMRGTESFVMTNRLVPSISSRAEKPLEIAMEKMWIILDYVADDENQEAFSDWRRDSGVYKCNAMAYFQSLPLYEHDAFRMTTEQHELIHDYAESAIYSVVPVHEVHHRRRTDALVTNITRAVCGNYNKSIQSG